jgi:hypothetical protein
MTAMATVTAASRALADHHRLAVELLARAKRSGLAGATVLPGFDRATLRIVVVDDRSRLDAWLDACADLIGSAAEGSLATTTIEDVEAARA